MSERSSMRGGRSGGRDRVPLGVQKLSLSVPDRLMDKNYVYRWVNDEQQRPNRLKEAEEGGYNFVQDPDILAEEKDSVDDEKRDSRISRYAGTNEDGSSYRCYLMRIKREWYKEDQEMKQAPLDELEQQLLGGNDEFDSEPDKRYVPKDGIQIKREQIKN